MSATPDGRWPFVSPENWLNAVDGALGRPFPAQRQRHETGFSTPSHHEVILQYSEEFWEERSTELFEAAEAEVEKGREKVARELSCRWGAPETLDLGPYSRATMAGLPLPEPLAYLGMLAPDALVWRRPEEDRWLALSIVKHDVELPFVLVAMFGGLGSLVEPPSHSCGFSRVWLEAVL